MDTDIGWLSLPNVLVVIFCWREALQRERERESEKNVMKRQN